MSIYWCFTFYAQLGLAQHSSVKLLQWRFHKGAPLLLESEFQILKAEIVISGTNRETRANQPPLSKEGNTKTGALNYGNSRIAH